VKFPLLKNSKTWLDRFKTRHQVTRMVTTLCKKPYEWIKGKLDGFYEQFDNEKKNYRYTLNMDETGSA